MTWLLSGLFHQTAHQQWTVIMINALFKTGLDTGGHASHNRSVRHPTHNAGNVLRSSVLVPPDVSWPVSSLTLFSLGIYSFLSSNIRRNIFLHKAPISSDQQQNVFKSGPWSVYLSYARNMAKWGQGELVKQFFLLRATQQYIIHNNIIGGHVYLSLHQQFTNSWRLGDTINSSSARK